MQPLVIVNLLLSVSTLQLFLFYLCNTDLTFVCFPVEYHPLPPFTLSITSALIFSLLWHLAQSHKESFNLKVHLDAVPVTASVERVGQSWTEGIRGGMHHNSSVVAVQCTCNAARVSEQEAATVSSVRACACLCVSCSYSSVRFLSRDFSCLFLSILFFRSFFSLSHINTETAPAT